MQSGLPYRFTISCEDGLGALVHALNSFLLATFEASKIGLGLFPGDGAAPQLYSSLS